MITNALDMWLGLHQEIQIIYVVDGFQATLFQDDSCTLVTVRANGETVGEALENLEKAARTFALRPDRS